MCLPILRSSAIAPTPSTASRYAVSGPKAPNPKTHDLRKKASTRYIQVAPSSNTTTQAVDRSIQGTLPRPATASSQIEEVKQPKATVYVDHLSESSPLSPPLHSLIRSQKLTQAAIDNNTQLPAPLRDLIVSYVHHSRKLEVISLQELIPFLKNSDQNAYSKLVHLIQQGLSLALLWMVDSEIPNFYFKLSQSIPWEDWESLDQMPFQTTRKLENIELYAHLCMFKKILEQRNNEWSTEKVGKLTEHIKTLSVRTTWLTVSVHKLDALRKQPDKRFPFPGSESDVKAKILWLNVVEVLYPRMQYDAKLSTSLEIRPNNQPFVQFTPKCCISNDLQLPPDADGSNETTRYQELLPGIRNNDTEAYKKLALLLQEGYSAASLFLWPVAIPNFYNKLASAISWDEIPFTTVRSLKPVEMNNHLSVLQNLLKHNPNLHPTSKEEQNLEIESILNHSLSFVDLQSQRIAVDFENFSASIELWYDMAKLLYPNEEIKLITTVSYKVAREHNIPQEVELRTYNTIHPPLDRSKLRRIDLKPNLPPKS